MPDKVCIQPCLGINTAASTAGRQAAYLAHEILLGPTKSDLGCSPALHSGVQEDVDFIMDDYVIAVETCHEECASLLIEQCGGEVHDVVRVDRVLEAAGIDIEQLPRDHLELDHPAVRAVADEIVATAHRLLGNQEDSMQ